MQDVSADQYITTITQTAAAFVETFSLSHEQMECSDGSDADQSVHYKNGLDQYVSFADCQRACQVLAGQTVGLLQPRSPFGGRFNRGVDGVPAK